MEKEKKKPSTRVVADYHAPAGPVLQGETNISKERGYYVEWKMFLQGWVTPAVL